MGSYLRTKVLPELCSNQARFYRSAEGLQIALVTWNWLSEEIEKEVNTTGGVRRNEWNCGERLFFNYLITPYDNVREVLHDMTHKGFPRRSCHRFASTRRWFSPAH